MGWREDVTFGNLTVTGSFNAEPSQFGGSLYGKPKVYFVSRNVTRSGDGTSWGQAFKTIGEAIAKVNQDYTMGYMPDNGRNRLIVIGEGWYSEVALTLTASDCTVISNASGNPTYGTVLYGSATDAGWDIGCAGPAIKVTGDNNTLAGFGVFCYNVLYAAIQNGEAIPPVSGAAFGNKFINMSAVRDVADGELGGLLDYGSDGTEIINFFGSTSCKDWGIKSMTDGVANPVNTKVIGGQMVGCPTGVWIQSGWNALVKDVVFQDDISDRPDVCDYPVIVTGGAMVTGCVSALAKASIVTGTGTIVDVNNWGSDSST
jgi:hypothetical protein